MKRILNGESAGAVSIGVGAILTILMTVGLFMLNDIKGDMRELRHKQSLIGERVACIEGKLQNGEAFHGQ